MDDQSRQDIRRLLKTFGVNADEAMVAHLARNPDVKSLRVRVTLEDLTDYGEDAPDKPLHVEVEEEINR